MKISNSVLAFVAAGTLAALPALTAAQSSAPQRSGETRQVELGELSTDGKVANLEDLVGKKVADFTLTDTEGKEHTLSDYLNDGKVVVLEWFCGTCPYVVRHYADKTTMNDTSAKYADKGVVWLAIASGRTADKDQNAKFVKDWEMEHPVLLDTTGNVGKTFGSKNTPAMYVIHKDGTLVYGGAIDDDRSGRKDNATNHVAEALDAVLAGSTVTTSYTKPYGCSVKYAR